MPTRLRSDLRDGVKGLVRYAQTDLRSVWAQVGDIAEAEAALRDVLPSLIDGFGAAAAAMAADWYDSERERLDLKDRGFRATPADLGTAGSQALVGWAATEANSLPAMQTLVEGGTQRRIANYSRETITASSIADPDARGWQRVGTGNCDFCSMLIERGAVYTSATAQFKAHDHCNCSAVPAFIDVRSTFPVPSLPDLAASALTSLPPLTSLTSLPYLPALRAVGSGKPLLELLPSNVVVGEVIASEVVAAAPLALGSRALPLALEARRVENLADLADDALEVRLSDLMAAGDFTSADFLALSAEIDRRDALRSALAVEVPDAPDPIAEQAALDALLDPFAAFDRVTDAEKAADAALRAASVNPAALAARAEKELRDEYDVWTHTQWLRAEEATRGVMLSREGRARGVSEHDFFTGKLSLKWASPELQEWFAQPGNQRMSFPEFRAGIRDDQRARDAAQRRKNRGYESEYG